VREVVTLAQAMTEVHKLRMQISRLVQDAFAGVDAGFQPRLAPPTDAQLHALRQLLTSAFIDHVAVRKDLVDPQTKGGRTSSSTRNVAYRAIGVPDDVFVHPSSALFHAEPPEVVVFAEVVRGSRPWMKSASDTPVYTCASR
jgi:ATP-dependent RNA helicase DHX37/DHR1